MQNKPVCHLWSISPIHLPMFVSNYGFGSPYLNLFLGLNPKILHQKGTWFDNQTENLFCPDFFFFQN